MTPGYDAGSPGSRSASSDRDADDRQWAPRSDSAPAQRTGHYDLFESPGAEREGRHAGAEYDAPHSPYARPTGLSTSAEPATSGFGRQADYGNRSDESAAEGHFPRYSPHSAGAPSAPATSSFSAPPAVSSPPTSGYGFPAQSSASPGYATAAPPPRRGNTVPLTAVLAVLLLIIVLVQGVLLYDTRNDVEDAKADTAAVKAEADKRASALEGRANEIEKSVLNPEAVAKEVKPSVFRVNVTGGSGTAFAFGREADGGATYLVTNAHVVQQDFARGIKTVTLEQENRRYNATIQQVDVGKDLAVLTSTEKFPRLQRAAEAARPGQPIVVVGAPLGIEGVVTSGVVSILRETSKGPVLQFDAPVNPGNSGGPVINAQKQVVGVVNAKLENVENFSLGIPVAVLCETFDIC
ncbi:serine protease [Virgisporangium aliadipatigenens]|uniref:Serine protease n=1 Tax=Virgisporangium aliadipatigenens TaxID=741659 RepID=A0A8J3YUP6_9ACTN|nr:S1C family serine protease [Virgisporangium aliadipatigenens]GIJ51871.1 serine protease [Virgisporangium aliadipatigenens]